MLIVHRVLPGPGWHPITYMVRLAAELLEAETLLLEAHQAPSFLQKVLATIPRRRGAEGCLVVCSNSRELETLLLVRGLRQRFRRIVAWVIDSFWTEWIPRWTRYSRLFDQFFITTLEDIPEWMRRTGTPTQWLPWGTDALRLGSTDASRDVDLLRVGRQPPEWDDDAATLADCNARGLAFHGRPAFVEDASQAERDLLRLFARSKYTLAFSNQVNPASYTHPRREYLTGRWTDALGCGAVVAGIAPRSPSATELLWDGATLELGTVRRPEGLARLAEAVRSWDRQQALDNHRRALERLDWRWRFAELAQALGASPARLRDELGLVRERLAALRQ